MNDSKPLIWSCLSITIINFIFFGRVSKPTKTRLATRITHFTIQFHSKNTFHFTNLNSLNIIKNMLLSDSQKRYSFYKFSGKPVSDGCQIKHFHCSGCTAPFLDAKKLYSQSTWEASVYIFL